MTPLPLPSGAAATAALTLFVAIGPHAVAQQPKVGAPAPAIRCDAWLNWQGDPPTLESLRGRVVLLEFWGTWCGPCVRAMPGIQKLHERYQQRGLTVLAISYEPKGTLQPFLKQQGYSMPVGSDPGKVTIAPYGVRGWPTTIVIDKEGKVAHVGSPYDAETAVEKALGLEAGPATLLTAWYEAQGQDPEQMRPVLDRLCEKATNDFDLRAWALSHLSPQPVPAGAADPAAGGKPAKAAQPAKPAPAAKADPGAASAVGAMLVRLMPQWSKDLAQSTALLQQIAAQAPPTFDLAAWAEQQLALAFPLRMAEVMQAIEARRYVVLLEDLVRREPDGVALATACKNREFGTWCRDRADVARTLAKRGLMAQLWLFGNAPIRDEKKNQEFFAELAMSGAGTSPDSKRIVSVLLDGEGIAHDRAQEFVLARMTESLAAADIAAGKRPRKDMKAQVAAALADLRRDLERRYGKPEPLPPK